MISKLRWYWITWESKAELREQRNQFRKNRDFYADEATRFLRDREDLRKEIGILEENLRKEIGILEETIEDMAERMKLIRDLATPPGTTGLVVGVSHDDQEAMLDLLKKDKPEPEVITTRVQLPDSVRDFLDKLVEGRLEEITDDDSIESQLDSEMHEFDTDDDEEQDAQANTASFSFKLDL